MISWKDVQKNLESSKEASRRRIEFVQGKKSSSSGSKQIPLKSNKTSNQPKKKQHGGIYPNDEVIKHMKWIDVRRAGPGMHNHGNTCFLNSTLQCLVHTPPLAQILLKDPNSVSGITRTEGHNAAITILFKRYIV
jgi:ubiquitin C-terminal hydrolase